MPNNPFLSETFTRCWLKHFSQGRQVTVIPGLTNLHFIRSTLLPVYYNVGKTHTKGISYSIDESKKMELGVRALLIYDLPDHRPVTGSFAKTYKLYRSRQYPGYYIDLRTFGSLAEYMGATFSKSTRYKLPKYRKRLEASFEIRYQMYYGEMERETYDQIFNSFHELLVRRFGEKGIYNNNLDPAEWEFYREVAHPMILEKKATLFVVFHKTEPISITLNYVYGSTLINAMTVFDVDFAKFHLGAVSLMALVDWCIQHKMEFLDFSKGYFEYKGRWSTHSYSFEYHVLYNPKSLLSKSCAYLIKIYFDIKQGLRDKDLNKKWHQFTYRWSSGGKNPETVQDISYRLLEKDLNTITPDHLEVDVQKPGNQPLRRILYEILYLHGGTYDHSKVYKSGEAAGSFVIKIDVNAWEITLIPN